MKKVLLVAIATLGLLSCDTDYCTECYTERRVTYFPQYSVEYVEVCYEVACDLTQN